MTVPPDSTVMHELVQQAAAILTAVSLLLTAIFSGYAAILSARNGRKADRIEAGVAEVHRATNGMKDELVASTGREQRAAGVIEGRAIEKAGTPAAVVVMLPAASPATPAKGTGNQPG